MNDAILICTDLDRTLLPNGKQPESSHAREIFTDIALRPEVSIVYVTGRHRQLVLAAIDDYDIPLPDYVIADVGTNIYTINSEWSIWKSWHDEIGKDWSGMKHDDLDDLFGGIEELRLQESEKQGDYKLSYYVPADVDAETLLRQMEGRLHASGIHASLIWSVDEVEDIGLVDVLPIGASKLHAVEFLIQRKGFHRQNTMFAGDSGNDLAVLTSEIQSVLVANASVDVRRRALQIAAEEDTLEALYLARGGFFGMNGNYSAGILEGLAHYLPDTKNWWKGKLKSKPAG